LTERTELERVLGAELLAKLVGVSQDGSEARLQWLALVIWHLSGSYNAEGIRRWFLRPRSHLRGQAPVDLLEGAWDPKDEGPQQIERLARLGRHVQR
jgi:hypothetical protein